MSRARYFELLPLLETDVGFGARVKPRVLARWRADTPVACGYSLLASMRITHPIDAARAGKHRPPLTPEQREGTGHFADTEAVATALAETLAAADRLRAEAIVFRTPASFTPSSIHRDVMRQFFHHRIGADVRRRAALVWDPEGVWDVPTAAALAEDLGLVLARDPLAPEAPPVQGNVVYFRMLGLGMARRRFSVDQLELLADHVAQSERAWVVFANPDKLRDARRFDALIRM